MINIGAGVVGLIFGLKGTIPFAIGLLLGMFLQHNNEKN